MSTGNFPSYLTNLRHFVPRAKINKGTGNKWPLYENVWYVRLLMFVALLAWKLAILVLLSFLIS